jgi:hypothetical protein
MNTPRIVFVIALIVVLSVGAAISTLAFENSAEGIGYVFGQFLAFAIISSLLAWRVWRRSPYKAATIVLVVGTLGLALVNTRKVLDGISAREARVALKDVRDPNQIDKALEQNPSNPALQLTAVVIKEANETIRVAHKIYAEIEPPALANEFNYNTASRADLEELLRNLRTAEANAMSAMPRITALFKDERQKVETFAQSLLPLLHDEGVRKDVMRGALTGIDNRHARSIAFNSKMLLAMAELYRALGKAIEIRIEQFGKYRVDTNGQLVFSNSLIADRYNAAANEINTATTRLSELEKEKKQLEQWQQEQWERFTSGK